ncbi:MAG: alpha/beta hydrolase [Pseudolabrys sp.]|jgi:pimeloyl-ACP methyl ester carboxylesterase
MAQARRGAVVLFSLAALVGVIAFSRATPIMAAEPAKLQAPAVSATQVKFGAVNIDGINIAYREAGDAAKPKLVLLHGFPSSSHQYRNLIQKLANDFHVIAPDYQGFGNSDSPDPKNYDYTFKRIAATMEKFLAVKGFDHYGMFVQDYGGPVGFRLFALRPEALDWLIVQNANAYEAGLSPAWDGLRNALWVNRTPETEKPLKAFFTFDAIKDIYLHGSRHPELISPDNWQSDFAFAQRPNAEKIYLDLFYDYRTNVELYPQWQKLLRERAPKTLILWGQNDPFFTPAGGEAFLRDLPKAEIHRLDAGHFAVEDSLDTIAYEIVRFHKSKVARTQ